MVNQILTYANHFWVYVDYEFHNYKYLWLLNGKDKVLNNDLNHHLIYTYGVQAVNHLFNLLNPRIAIDKINDPELLKVINNNKVNGNVTNVFVRVFNYSMVFFNHLIKEYINEINEIKANRLYHTAGFYTLKVSYFRFLL